MKDNICIFAALEPTWHHYTSIDELKGLLNLSLLFNDMLYINDIQLGDNPLLFHSYLKHKRDPNHLYGALVQFIKLGLIKVLIRDKIFVPKSRTFSAVINRDCTGISDVYHSWKSYDLQFAGVNNDNSDFRIEYNQDIDNLLNNNYTSIYPYTKLKSLFRQKVKKLLFSDLNNIFKQEFLGLPENIKNDYYQILERDWFTHGDLHNLFMSQDININNFLVNIHGLINEECYSDFINGGLVGFDLPSAAYESFQWQYNTHSEISEVKLSSLHNEIFDYAVRKLDSPSLNILSILSPDDIIEIRENGLKIFNLIQFNFSSLSPESCENLKNNYVEALENYWLSICDFLKIKYPEITITRNKLGLFVREQLPTISRLPNSIMSFTINSAINLIPNKIIKDSLKSINTRLLDKLSFKFIYFKDTKDFSKIRRAIPKTSWITNKWS